MPQLEGKVALVTGGSRGIGRAIALAFAREGADVAIASRSPDGVEAAAKEVQALGRRGLGLPTDIGDGDAVDAMVDRTVAELGGLDILVNNAGAAPFLSSVDAIRRDGFEKYFRVNFFGAFYASQAAGRVFLANGSGCVINVASIAGMIASPGVSYYAAAKAAMINLTRTTAREWASSGIRVNAIAPGWVETEMNEKARESDDWYETVRAMIPLGRWATPEDVAGVAVFLASDAAAFMTGAVVVVDGGQTLMNLVGG